MALADEANSRRTTSPKANFTTLLIMVFVSFLILVAILVFAGYKSASAFSEEGQLVVQNAKVEVMRVQVQNSFVKPRVVFGQLEAFQQADLGFELSGMLSELTVDEGQFVNAGDSLAKLDTVRLKARKAELDSALARAEADAKLASLSNERVEDLVNKQLEPVQVLDEAQAQVDASNAAVSEAQARLATLQVDIQKSTISAPFSGQVVKRFVDKGTVVTAGQPIFSLIQNTQLEARLGLPDETAFGLKIGQAFTLQVNGSSVNATVKSIAQQRNLATRTIDTVFSIDTSAINASQAIALSAVSGDLVSLTVDIPTKTSGAWVPISALASGVRGLWTLYVVGDDSKIETRLVSIQYTESDRAFVSGAINDGEKLIVSGIHRLSPKQTVLNEVDVSEQLSNLVGAAPSSGK